MRRKGEGRRLDQMGEAVVSQSLCIRPRGIGATSAMTRLSVLNPVVSSFHSGKTLTTDQGDAPICKPLPGLGDPEVWLSRAHLDSVPLSFPIDLKAGLTCYPFRHNRDRNSIGSHRLKKVW